MKRLTILILTILLAAAFFGGHQLGVSNTKAKAQRWQEDSLVVRYDSIEVKNVIAVEAPTRVDTLSIPVEIDTSEILADYFSRKSYESQYRDSSLAINFKPVISHNRLDSLDFSYRILRPEQVSYFSENPKHELYAGVMAGGLFAGPKVQWSIKDRWLVGAGYNLLNQPGKLQLSLTYRIAEF